MLISARTMVNTTIFWIIILVGFRWYTRWVDSTPAQQMLQAIGWDEFAALSLPSDENETCKTTEIYDKLLILEGMVQSTNMNCSVRNITTENTISPSFPSTYFPSSSPDTSSTLQIAVFNSTLDWLLPPGQQANTGSFAMISRPATNLDSIDDIVTLLKNTTLTPTETQAGYINLFANNPFTISSSSLDNRQLSLVLDNIESLASAQLILLEQALKNTFVQFPQITEVSISY